MQGSADIQLARNESSCIITHLVTLTILPVTGMALLPRGATIAFHWKTKGNHTINATIKCPFILTLLQMMSSQKIFKIGFLEHYIHSLITQILKALGNLAQY
jgi:hypothetical protein